MKTSHYLKMRLLVVPLLTTLTAVATSTQSFAQLLPGEVSNATEEFQDGKTVAAARHLQRS
jgi:hypothetical protein